MENNIENKAKFFALYHGQEIMRCEVTSVIRTELMRTHPDYAQPFYFLELKPISGITDYDAQKLQHEGAKDASRYYNIWEASGYDVDYLRSKGYALPWMGLSVEQLISYGWIKLKTE